jgi:hypothetical protein
MVTVQTKGERSIGRVASKVVDLINYMPYIDCHGRTPRQAMPSVRPHT